MCQQSCRGDGPRGEKHPAKFRSRLSLLWSLDHKDQVVLISQLGAGQGPVSGGNLCKRKGWFASRDCHRPLLNTTVRCSSRRHRSACQLCPSSFPTIRGLEHTKVCLWLRQSPWWGETALQLKCGWSPLKTLSICFPRPFLSLLSFWE